MAPRSSIFKTDCTFYIILDKLNILCGSAGHKFEARILLEDNFNVKLELHRKARNSATLYNF